MVLTIEFSVVFDPEVTLKQGKHHLVTPVLLLYYDQYSENEQGDVVNKGNFFSTPLANVEFDFEIPGQ